MKTLIGYRNGLNILPSYTTYFNLNTATLGLQTSAVFIGTCCSGLIWTRVSDVAGRRPALMWASLITILAAVLQSAAQNMAMFIIARILIGFGSGASGISAAVYLEETLPARWKVQGLGFYNDFYFVGALIAAGVTYATARMESTWAWRLPSALQGLFGVISIISLFFVPESPQWLVSRNELEKAFAVVAFTHANGDETDGKAYVEFQRLMETQKYEKNITAKRSWIQLFKVPLMRKRVLLALSAGVFAVSTGGSIPAYYLGTMLTNAGLTSVDKQLQVNVILNVWCLACSIVGTYLLAICGRKSSAIVGNSWLTLFMFLLAALTKLYGNSTNLSGVYGTIAVIFLYQGASSTVWTPLYYVYPPELLYFGIRSQGMAMLQFLSNGIALLIVFILPSELEAIGWKTYLTNAVWNVLVTIAIWYCWIETKGKSSEQIDRMLTSRTEAAVVCSGNEESVIHPKGPIAEISAA